MAVMKKIINILLVITSMMFCFAYTASADEGEKNKELLILEYMGLAEEGATSSELLITRAEYLQTVLKTIGIPFSAVDSEPIFTDMTKAHKYHDAVVTAYSMGIIQGYSGLFRPDDYVTGHEAMIMTVNAIVGRQLSEDMVRFTADKLDLYDDVSLGTTVSYSQMCRILFNVLSAYRVGYETDNGQVQITFDGDETYFESVWDIYQYEGMVEAADGLSVYGEPWKADIAVLDDRIFSAKAFSMGEYLGMNMHIFYEDNDGDNTIVYAYADKDNIFSQYTYHDFDGYNADVLKFYDGTKTQSYRVNSKTTYILNGKLLNGNEIANVFKTNQGTYKLIDNNADDTYDLVILNTPTVYSPSAIDKEREVIVDSECGELDLSKFSSYIITDVRGKVITIDDLLLGRRLLVYNPSSTKYNIRVVMLEEEQDVAITAKTPDGGYEKITTDSGVQYVFSAFSRFDYDEIELKTKYTVYFDNNGEIIDAQLVSRDDVEPVYLTNMAYDDGPETLYVEGMKLDSTIGELKFAKKVSVRKSDGTTKGGVKAGKELFDLMRGNETKVTRQLIFVKYNSEREITKIYQISQNASDPYHLQPYEQYADNNGTKQLQVARRWMSATTSFSNQVQLKQTTKVFVAPYTTIETPDKTLMTVTAVSSFVNDTNYDMYNPEKNTGYKLVPVVANADELAADFLVIECPEGKTFGKTDRIQGVVINMSKVYDEYNDEILTELTLMNSGGSISKYSCEATIESRVSVGDIVELKYLSGKLRDRDVLLYYDADYYDEATETSGKIYITTSFDNKDADGNVIEGDNLIGWRYYANMRITQGTVKKVDGNYAMLDTMQNKINLTEFVDISTAKIIKFNLKKGEYEQYDKGYLMPDDEYIGILKMGKMMMFIMYER